MERQDPEPLIGIVVGEASGDILGVGLLRALRQSFPTAKFVGIGGPRMLAEGFESLFPQDRLAVMGLVEPLKRLPELLSIRRQLIQFFIAKRPMVVIGIDAPDFNLDLEAAVRKAGIKTVHYVSPSVWAWRQWRIKKIAKAVDLMLTLLPFEAQFYRDHNVPVQFVGHPLADDIPLATDQAAALEKLHLAKKMDGEAVVALLPGSRSMEVQRMGELFVQTAELLRQRFAQIRFIMPSANAKRHEQLQGILDTQGRDLPITLISGESCTVMEAADVVLMASGTTTLEALLLKRPMVIAYKVAPLSFYIIRSLAKVKFVGLPNLLAGREIVPERLQNDATPASLCDAVARWLESPPEVVDRTKQEFEQIHIQLRKNASESAAKAITTLIKGDVIG